MDLTEGQKKLVLNRINEMGWNAQCQVCRTNEWEFDDIVISPTLKEGNQIDLENTVPEIHMTCNRCGYIMAFSAVKLGLIP
jgi:predicted nucleic-acid-binding Zn-ribbon protein